MPTISGEIAYVNTTLFKWHVFCMLDKRPKLTGLQKPKERRFVRNRSAAVEKIRSRVEFIDAAKAANWLTRNTRNRPVKGNLVKRISDQIRNDEWALNGESIIWASDNVLVDGQHRLLAIIEAGVTAPGLPCVVVYGVSPDSFKTVDNSIPRGAKDDLGLLGFKYTTRTSAAGALLYMYRNYGTMLPARRPSRSQTVNMLMIEPRLIDSIQAADKIHRQLPNTFKTHTMVLHYLFDQVDPELNELFWKHLVEGSGLEKDSPILVLRNRIISTFTGSSMRNAYASAEYAAITIKAFNAFVAGQRVGQLRWKGTGKYAEDFPQVTNNAPRTPQARAAVL